ncbi:MAG: membrane protein insertase YidC [Geobacteraceae bacterium]|nr:membrane protein insertase YidC [Geobacteraceae bacterium]
MEKRVLIAVVLSIAVMYGYSILFPPAKQITAENKSAQTSQQVDTTASNKVLKTNELTAQQVANQVPVNAANDSDVQVETDNFSVVFSATSGALKKVTLKKFTDLVGSGAKQVVLHNENASKGYNLLTDYSGLNLGPMTFTPDRPKLVLSGDEKKFLEFSAVTSSGAKVVKRYIFSGSGYGITLENVIKNGTAASIEGTIQTVLRSRSAKPKEDAGRYEVFSAASKTESGVTFNTPDDIAKAEKSFSNTVNWTAFGDKYFLTALIAKDKSISTLNIKSSEGFIEQRVSSPKITINPGAEISVPYEIYIGPKDIDVLKAQNHNLEGVIDLGWFAVIAKPLLHSLKLFYKYLHNYGLAIIAITVILKIIFFPLTHKSYKSMKEMQKLQPQMQALKEKFKDDRDGLNKSVMELYKTHKVNPLGGCLPMVVQIPVFFGLYKALMFSIELRHAPFYLWIMDLSSRDPYYITPIIMGITMFIQQKMTPTNMDPVQAKMMLALPVVFTAMFLNFPSGLVLYWLVNNILTIAQQMYINKTLKEA